MVEQTTRDTNEQSKAKWKNYLEDWRDYFQNEWGLEPKELRNLTIAALTLVATLVPILVVIAFSGRQGLPALDVLDTLGGHIGTLFFISVALTILTAITFSLPGLVRLARLFLIEENKQLENGEKCEKCGYTIAGPKPIETQPKICEECHNPIRSNLRMSWALHFSIAQTSFPGLFMIALMIAAKACWFSENTINEAVLYGLAAGLLPMLAWSAVGLVYTRKAETKRGNKSHSKEWFTQANAMWIPIALIDGALLFTWLQIIGQVLSNNFGDVSFEQYEEYNANLLVSASLSLAASVILFLTGAWATNKPSFLRGAGAIFIITFILVVYFPGLTTLFNNHLSMLSQGGGARVVLTTDRDLVEEWPMLYEFTDKDGALKNSSKFARTKVLHLTLLGDDRLYIKLNRFELDQIYGQSQVELDRSRIKSIVFLGRPESQQK